MTPDRKAKELYDKFYGVSQNIAYLEIIANRHATICVQEIIKVVTSAHDKLGIGEIGELKDYIPYIYWQQVLSQLKS